MGLENHPESVDKCTSFGTRCNTSHYLQVVCQAPQTDLDTGAEGK
jgi:hypothetical protein